MAMSRSSSWKQQLLTNRLKCDGVEYSVDLVARKATGVEGWEGARSSTFPASRDRR